MNDDVKRHLRMISMMHEALGNIVKEFHKGKENQRVLSSELLGCAEIINHYAKEVDKDLLK